MSESCKFPSLDSCQKRFLWTHKEAAVAPHPVGEGDTDTQSQAGKLRVEEEARGGGWGVMGVARGVEIHENLHLSGTVD